MPKLPSNSTAAALLAKLSPYTLNEFTRATGTIMKARSALMELGKQATEDITLTKKRLDAIWNVPINKTIFPPLHVASPTWPVNRGTDVDVLAVTQPKTELAAKLPKRAQWSNLQCHFTDNSTLSVSYRGQRIGRYDYEKLDFGRKNMGVQKQDVQWELLYKLAALYSYEGGKLAEPTVAVLAEMLGVSEATLFKRMSRLSQKLQQAFGIDDTPFLDYLPTTGYRTQFSLRTEPFLRGHGRIRFSGSQILDKHTPDSPRKNDWD